MNQEIRKLEEQIKHHKSLYYQGNPEISDIDFDKLEERLRALDPLSPILNLIGTTAAKENKCKHETKMLSLNKTYVVDDLVSWIDMYEVISMHKIDGVSCSIVYESGRLVLAKTRGDGLYGENVTEKIKWFADVPTTIHIKENCEIRGELFCTEENFVKLSDEMISRGLDKPTSQRNIVAGLIGRKENLDLCRHLSFYAFDLISISLNIKKESEKFTLLKKNNFKIPQIEIHKDCKEIEKSLEEAMNFMSDGEYQIDGIVFSYNDLDLQDRLGNTAHHPRYKMAFKFAGDSKKTKILSISWQVSRNGILTPIANVEPVELGGATISRVTLHNFGQVKAHNLKSNDEIMIIRSGEVIPKFLSVIKESKNDFEYPKNCPSCNNKTVILDIRLLCENASCPGRVREEILNFISKIGIDDLSEKRVQEVMNLGILNGIPDLFRIKKEDLLKIDKVKDKLATKLINSIEDAKDVDLVTFLSSLGIRGGAYNKCEKVVLAGNKTIEDVLNLTEEKITEIDGFAEKSGKDFLSSLKEKESLIKEVLSLGLKIKKDDKEKTAITFKKICITGSLTRKRSEIEQLIREKGGVVTSSVSKATDFLLTNDKEGKSSKFKKATTLDIPIISEDDFIEMIDS